MVNSTTPRFGPRCPPFLERTVISSCRISSASCCNWSSLSFFTCSGLSTMSRYRFIAGGCDWGVQRRGGSGAAGTAGCPHPKTPILRSCDGWLARWMGLFPGGIVRELDGVEHEFAGGVLLQLLDFQLGFDQLGLTDPGQVGALLEAGQHRLQR